METKESKIYDLILRIDDFYLTNNDQLEGFIFHEEFLGCFIFVQLNGLGIKSLKDNTRFKISIEGNVINLTSILDEKDEVDEKYDFYSLPYANEEFLVLANTNDDYPKLDIQTIGFEDFSTTGIINKKVASSLNKNKLHINKVLDYILKCKRLRNNNKIIINVSDFIQTINETVPKKDSFSLFRGHYNHKYLPIPSLIRNTKYLENENYLYREFKMKFMNDLKSKNYIETLTMMQHYGLPTRLLDTTSNPLVALYFACKKTEMDDNGLYFGEVIHFNSFKSKLKYYDSDRVLMLSTLPLLSYNQQKELKDLSEKVQSKPIKSDKTYIKFLRHIKREIPSFDDDIDLSDLMHEYYIKVGMINERINAQSGNFIIFGLKEPSVIEKEILKTRAKKSRIFVWKKEEILKELDILNINDSTMFPDMVNTATYLKNNLR